MLLGTEPIWAVIVGVAVAFTLVQSPADGMHMLWGVALLFTAVSMKVFWRSIDQPFGMPFWGLSFPLAASAALSLHLAPVQGPAHGLAMAWLGWVTLVIGALLWATVRGLLQGRLLLPEPPPQP